MHNQIKWKSYEINVHCLLSHCLPNCLVREQHSTLDMACIALFRGTYHSVGFWSLMSVEFIFPKFRHCCLWYLPPTHWCAKHIKCERLHKVFGTDQFNSTKLHLETKTLTRTHTYVRTYMSSALHVYSEHAIIRFHCNLRYMHRTKQNFNIRQIDFEHNNKWKNQ